MHCGYSAKQTQFCLSSIYYTIHDKDNKDHQSGRRFCVIPGRTQLGNHLSQPTLIPMYWKDVAHETVLSLKLPLAMGYLEMKRGF